MEHIKELMKAGDVKVAAEELKKRLAAEPDNAEAKMLYGTCCHLLGDDETFKKIHDELVPKMEVEKDEKKVSLWRKYHRLWLIMIAVGELVLVGTTGLYIFGKGIFIFIFGKESVAQSAETSKTLYAGPRFDFIDTSENLYAGPPLYEQQKIDTNGNFKDSE